MLQIQLFGTWSVTYEGRLIADVQAKRVQLLFVYLLLHASQPISRRQLAFLFWPDSSERQAMTNLRRQLHFLRKALPAAEDFIAIEPNTLQWRPRGEAAVDVLAFEGHLEAVEALMDEDGGARDGALDRMRAHLMAAMDVYQGDLLPDCYEEWILPIQESLRQRYVQAGNRLMTLLEEAGEYETAIQYGQRLVRHDSLHEETYRRLMHLFMLSGDRAKALSAYHTCTSLLQRELGVEPHPSTQALYRQLATQEYAEPEQVPALREEGRAALPARLIARREEWAQLLAAWRKAEAGRAAMVLIAGEAGIGKSRLAEELFTWAKHKGVDSARTRSYPMMGKLAYAPIVEWLRTPELQRRMESVDSLWLSDVARLLPDLLLARPDVPPPLPLSENWQRQRMFEALVQVISATPRPLLLLLDDLQWSDRETLEWLQFLLQSATAARLLVVGTVRMEEVEEEHALHQLVYTLQRSGQLTELGLARLDREQTTALAQQVSGRTLSPGEVATLYESTDGNPLFIVETVRAQFAGKEGATDASGMIGEGQFPRSGIERVPGLPPKVHAVIQSRLVQLSPHALTLVGVMSVIGRAFSYELLAAVSFEMEETLVASLDELWRRNIIREKPYELVDNGSGFSAYDFSHDRIRDVAYAQLSLPQRRRLHHGVAEALARFYAARGGEISSQLAYHYDAAGAFAAARTHHRRAGEHAAAHFAHEDAIHHLERALDLTDEADVAERFRLHRLCERVYHAQTDRGAQMQQLNILLDLAQQMDDPAAQAEAFLGYGECRVGMGDYRGAKVHVQRAIGLAEDAGSKSMLARSLIQHGAILWNEGEYRTAQERFQDALVLTRALGDARLEATVLQHLGTVYVYTAGYAETLQLFQEALRVSKSVDDRTGEVWLHNQIAFLIMEQGEGDYAEAERHYQAGLQIARTIGNREFEVKLSTNLAALYERCGEYGQGVVCLERSLAVAEETSSLRQKAFALTYRGMIYVGQARFSAAYDHYQEALALFRQIGYRQGEGKVLRDLSLLQWFQHEYAAGVALAQEAVEIATELGIVRDQAWGLTRLGYGLVSLGRLSEACDACNAALSLFRGTEQRRRSVEALAGLAQVALAWSDENRAAQFVERIVQVLNEVPLDVSPEAMIVYEVVLQLLDQRSDRRGRDVRQMAVANLQKRAASLVDPNDQRRFWQDVALHRDFL